MRTMTLLALMMLGITTAHSAEVPYQGLIHELRSVDDVVLFEAQEIKRVSALAEDARFLIRGRVAEVYQGNLKSDGLLEFEMSAKELADRNDQPMRTDKTLFGASVTKNETAVVLLNGADRRLVNILQTRPYMADCVEASHSKSDADVMAKLARIYLNSTLKPKEHIPYLIALNDDLKRFGAKTDSRNEVLTGIAKEFRETIMRSFGGYADQFQAALWIGSYLPEKDRKEIARSLLIEYDKRLDAYHQLLKERGDLQFAQRTTAAQNAGESAPDPIPHAEAWARAVVRDTYLLVDTSWHSRWCRIQEGGRVLPRDVVRESNLSDRVLLLKVQAFAKDPR